MTNSNERRSGRIEPGAARASRGIDREDHQVLAFAVMWLPYGGPPGEETLVRFGLTRDRYLDRLRLTICRHRSRIHPNTAARLFTLCDGLDSNLEAGALNHASQAVPHSAH